MELKAPSELSAALELGLKLLLMPRPMATPRGVVRMKAPAIRAYLSLL